jgi:hypothetical protein
VYPQGEAFPVRTVVGRQYVHAAGVFADVIVSVADEDMTETQVALMADQVALLLWEAVGPSAP